MGQAAIFSVRVDPPEVESNCLSRLPDVALLLHEAIECLDEAVVITAAQAESNSLSVLYANPAFREISGLDPNDLAQGFFVTEALEPLWSSLRESHRQDGPFETDTVVNRPDGLRTVLSVRSPPRPNGDAYRIAFIRDISEQTQLAESLRRNERLACIGLLAAGIAHEINNPTGSALLAAETALAIMDQPRSASHVAACLQNIATSMDRCGRIVRTLLRYTRDEPSEKQACSINDVAQQTLDLARPYAERYGARLHMELDPEVPLAPMNPLEIELVLVNLVRNAVENGTENIEVTIRTARAEQGVQAAVIDNGRGMNREQLAHVFDPLYTTRRQVGGSGLGMCIAQGIVQAHRGRMEVASQPGSGTTVTIFLPLEEPLWHAS